MLPSHLEIASLSKASWADSSLLNQNLVSLSSTQGYITLYTNYQAGKRVFLVRSFGNRSFLCYCQQWMRWLSWKTVWGLFKKLDSQSAFLCQRCCNSYGIYLAIKKLCGSGRRGVILLLKGKQKWGWSSFEEVLRREPCTPQAVALPPLAQLRLTIGRSFARVVSKQRVLAISK